MKKENLRKGDIGCKEETNGNFRTEECNKRNKLVHGSITEWRGQRKESVNLEDKQ